MELAYIALQCLAGACIFAGLMLGVPALTDLVIGRLRNQTVPNLRQRGMVLLGKSYKGYAAGAVVQLATQEETSLVAQGLATTSAGPVTSGAVSTTATAGRVGIAAGQPSVVITHPQIDANSKVWAVINQAAADGTLTSIVRVVPAAGSVTIYGNANATAITYVDWMLMMVSGELPPQP